MKTSDIQKWEYEEELRVGLKFPNWAPCPYRDNKCPSLCRESREAKLLMHYCSNNESIHSCYIYRILKKDD